MRLETGVSIVSIVIRIVGSKGYLGASIKSALEASLIEGLIIAFSGINKRRRYG